MTKREIKIKGAGISGLTAAINLAKAGWPVTVYEAREAPGAHREGDFQGLENWTVEEDVLDSLRGMGIETTFPAKAWHEIFVHDPSRARFRSTSERPFFYLIRRGSADDCLDAHLARQAVQAGARIVCNARLEDDEAEISAIGEAARVMGVGRGCVFNTDHADAVVGLLDNRIAPIAYAYFISWRETGTIAVCLTQDFRNADTYLDRAIEAFQDLYGFRVDSQRRFSCAENLGILKKRHKTFTGQAAGLQDALAGFGMRYAFSSGYLAAKAILEDGDYWDAVKRELHPCVRAGIVNRFFYNMLFGGAVGNYTPVLRRMMSGDLLLNIRKGYRPSRLKDALYLFARFVLRKKLVS